MDIMPGESIHSTFGAELAVCSCTTAAPSPAMDHMANDMYVAIVVDPKKPLPPPDRS